MTSRSFALIAGLFFTIAVLMIASMAAAENENIFIFEEDIITGEIEKPEAFYVLRASSLDYEFDDRAESFLEELRRTVDHEAF